jgi:hypothetical protein
MFVKRVRETLKIPVLGLFDSDAHGLKILSVYMQGSESMSHDAASLATPDIKWLGVRPSDLEKSVFVFSFSVLLLPWHVFSCCRGMHLAAAMACI